MYREQYWEYGNSIENMETVLRIWEQYCEYGNSINVAV